MYICIYGCVYVCLCVCVCVYVCMCVCGCVCDQAMGVDYFNSSETLYGFPLPPSDGLLMYLYKKVMNNWQALPEEKGDLLENKQLSGEEGGGGKRKRQEGPATNRSPFEHGFLVAKVCEMLNIPELLAFTSTSAFLNRAISTGRASHGIWERLGRKWSAEKWEELLEGKRSARNPAKEIVLEDYVIDRVFESECNEMLEQNPTSPAFLARMQQVLELDASAAAELGVCIVRMYAYGCDVHSSRYYVTLADMRVGKRGFSIRGGFEIVNECYKLPDVSEEATLALAKVQREVFGSLELDEDDIGWYHVVSSGAG